MTINRRNVQAHDVEFEILYCGICHSDLHQIKDDFGGTMWPIVPDHELLGKVTAIGHHVKNYKVGDLVGVGCIAGSCGQTQEMLDFCFKHNITADSEIINIQDVNTAFDRLEKGDIKYRFVIDMASLES
ncbi:MULTISPECIES: alcohol dehydrogenase catalytic domain-containing protein [Sphingobacterium]|uniref:alcohol dehydrogenase catalytic domain-containing protein n=1 Tax=Sphingobacterium TaxID=28453 RepID=UPI0025802EC3|nr:MULTISPECIES: alcohol dehydrogenase catalytic domain-containing protein [Sphingobacterium]